MKIRYANGTIKDFNNRDVRSNDTSLGWKHWIHFNKIYESEVKETANGHLYALYENINETPKTFSIIGHMFEDAEDCKIYLSRKNGQTHDGEVNTLNRIPDNAVLFE
jgi:hypothetical protein